ncbi:MAG: DUF4304 domain-containing protein [Acidobacteriia bacterium]|nr:DUF4304 domain-containing protein [Terriglobia bacterium]
MNKNAVQKNIWAGLAPFLNEAGFRILGNTARRFFPLWIDVIGLQWFGGALAKRLECTPNSFSVRLGCYFRFIPSMASLEMMNGEPLPEEAHCHIRKTLFRAFVQPGCNRKDIWFVDTVGSHLEEITSQLQVGLSQEALPWFQRFSDLREVLRILREDSEDEAKAFGFGRIQSPVRNLLTGFVALQVGDKKLAATDLQKALEAGCFGTLAPKIESAIELAR